MRDYPNQNDLRKHSAGFELKNCLIGGASSAFIFSLSWPLDTAVTRQRNFKKKIWEKDLSTTIYNYKNSISVNGEYKGFKPLARSFLNKGYYWGLTYTLLAGAIFLPMQNKLANTYHELSEKDDKESKLFLNSLAAWHAAMLQLTILHPIDSMKINIQKQPDLFKQKSIKNTLLNEQAKLRRGTGVVAIGSISHFFGWTCKQYVESSLSDSSLSKEMINITSSLAYALTHMLIAFPFNAVKSFAQMDNDLWSEDKNIKFNPKNASLKEKALRTGILTKEMVKKVGPSIFYRGFLSRGSMHIASQGGAIASYFHFTK